MPRRFSFLRLSPGRQHLSQTSAKRSEDRSMEMRIAVVGAGIIGCLVAHEALAANPSAQITLVERDLAGLGASQRSAGVHFPVGRTERVRSMSLYSQRYYAALASRDADLPIFPLDF